MPGSMYVSPYDPNHHAGEMAQVTVVDQTGTPHYYDGTLVAVLTDANANLHHVVLDSTNSDRQKFRAYIYPNGTVVRVEMGWSED